MCVLAHPDDESLGCGSVLARYAAEGVRTAVITATRGERGWAGIPPENPGAEALGELREAELRAAAQTLGVGELHLLGYMDGEVDQANPAEIIGKLVGHIRRFRPQVVITFDPFGFYGHPDHIAISQFTTAALIAAADPRTPAQPDDVPTHAVSKFYYIADSTEMMAAYDELQGGISMEIDGQVRHEVAWPPWSISAEIDPGEHWDTVWAAIQCHASQRHLYANFFRLPQTTIRELWGKRTLYRAASLVSGGRARESDLFEGLR